uniref:Uncharacterized protein n=1 Tax=Glossina palpalis gambiensis TaxID=67801 RepID=A0A1B0AXL9_9MUSC
MTLVTAQQLSSNSDAQNLSRLLHIHAIANRGGGTDRSDSGSISEAGRRSSRTYSLESRSCDALPTNREKSWSKTSYVGLTKPH